METCNSCCFEQESHAKAVAGMRCQQLVLEGGTQMTVAWVQDSDQSACAFGAALQFSTVCFACTSSSDCCCDAGAIWCP